MNKCDCYYTEEQIIGWHTPVDPITKMMPRCNGTKERDSCSCGGDRTKCDFYPEVREKESNVDKVKEIHAYKNYDGTYRVEGIGYATDNGELKEVRFEMPRAKLTVEPLVQKEDQVLFSFEVKEN